MVGVVNRVTDRVDHRQITPKRLTYSPKDEEDGCSETDNLKTEKLQGVHL